MTAGPWRPIYFHTYDIRIAEVWANAIVSEKLERRVDLSFELAGDEFTGTVQVSVRGPNKASIKAAKGVKVAGGKGFITCMFGDDETELWYPVRCGKQPLYEIEVAVVDDVSVFSASTDEGISQRTARHGTGFNDQNHRVQTRQNRRNAAG